MKKTRWFILGLTAVICVAVFVNWKYFNSQERPEDEGSTVQGDSSDKNMGDASEVLSPQDDSYFDTARYSRKKARDEAVAVLNILISNQDTEEAARQAAYAEITAYAKLSEKEAAVENLIKAKGFDDCIVFLTKDTASIVIGCESLSSQQAAQISDIVTGETGLSAAVVKIIPYT